MEGHALSPADEAELRRFFGEIGLFDHLVLTLGTQSITLPFAQLNDGHLRDAMDSKYMAHVRTLRAALGHVRRSVTWLTGAAARTALPRSALGSPDRPSRRTGCDGASVIRRSSLESLQLLGGHSAERFSHIPQYQRSCRALVSKIARRAISTHGA
jgi:hypothetical protein